MNYFLKLPDARSHTVATSVAQTVENMGTELEGVSVDRLVMGMQHQLGMVAALTMEGIPQNAEEIANHLLGLSGIAGMYLKALVTENPETPDQENADAL